jgi:hypothetical protein
VSMAGQLTSPQATGGAGAIFEYRVAAIMLSRLIRGAPAPVGFQLPVFRVGFQQRNAGYPLDDFVAYALPRDGSPAPRVQFQVKKRVGITAGNHEFRQVVAAAVETCRLYEDEVQRGHLLLGLAAGESAANPADFDDLVHLTEMARAHAGPETFKLQIRKGVTRERRRTLFDNISAVVAAEAAARDVAVIDHLTHQFLLSLHVWHVLADDDGKDWRAELDALSGLATQAGLAVPDLMAHLCNLAAFFEKHGGLVSAPHVQQQLLGLFGVNFSLPGEDFRRKMPGINVTNYGTGNVFAADSQVFNINFSSNPS